MYRPVLDPVGGSLALSALFAMLPWHWRWAQTDPVEGVTGRLVA